MIEKIKILHVEYGVYGEKVEIRSFVEIYNANILICWNDDLKPYEIGMNNNNNGASKVLLSGVVHAGHCDVINCSNSDFWENYKKKIWSQVSWGV